ncbi:MAG: VOC family protein [Roseibium sp.]|uniref:VOC family protein n=1 Tax=Roseibium sp. TaxID=1936156 RepID=UPI00260B79F9|nr:VOC family protein [Roseibium sp.]MCV0423945.1 VOC family protein [Roseibium sp.]
MKPMIYLFFKGDCLEAMTHYAAVLGGRIQGVLRNADAPAQEFCMPGGGDMILNMSMVLEDNLVMASDNSEETYRMPQGFRISIEPDTLEDFERVHASLAREARTVEMEPCETFWAERFALFTDRYGTPWMLNYTGSKETRK